MLLTTRLHENIFTKKDSMFDTVIRTNFVDSETLVKITEYLKKSKFYINEGYGDFDKFNSIGGITDEQMAEMGMPPVPDYVLRTHRISHLSGEIRVIVSEINRVCEQLIFDTYDRKMIDMRGGGVARYKNGQCLPVHQDWSITDWVEKNNLPVVHLSSVFYINDNYAGGELCFSSRKIDGYSPDIMSIKPQAGTIIFFDALRWHAAAPVVDGEKYAITNFYTLD